MIVRNSLHHGMGNLSLKSKAITNLGGEIFNKEAQQYTVYGWREVVPKNLKHPEGWGTISVDDPYASISSHEWSEEKSKPPARIKEARLLSLMEKAGKDIEDKDAEAMAGKGLEHNNVQMQSKNYFQRLHFTPTIRCSQCYTSWC